MFRTSAFAYWCCQLIGWGMVWGALELNGFHLGKAIITCIAGFLATHLLRTVMRRYIGQTQSFRKEGFHLLLAIVFTTALATAFKSLGFYFFEEYRGILTSYGLFLRIPADYLFVIIPWTLIYWFYRLVVRERVRTLERRRLEWRLKEMQTRAGETGITMEGLMDEINHIIKLIDENPASARNEITNFSRLLREGYLDQAGT